MVVKHNTKALTVRYFSYFPQKTFLAQYLNNQPTTLKAQKKCFDHTFLISILKLFRFHSFSRSIRISIQFISIDSHSASKTHFLFFLFLPPPRLSIQHKAKQLSEMKRNFIVTLKYTATFVLTTKKDSAFKKNSFSIRLT